MELDKLMLENGDIEFEYCDVSDDELVELVETYPEILDESDDIHDRYTRLIQFDTHIINDGTFDEMATC
jgi:hypothetical protein